MKAGSGPEGYSPLQYDPASAGFFQALPYLVDPWGQYITFSMREASFHVTTSPFLSGVPRWQILIYGSLLQEFLKLALLVAMAVGLLA